jgi:tetratricopeptide (TPR) repeat protein
MRTMIRRTAAMLLAIACAAIGARAAPSQAPSSTKDDAAVSAYRQGDLAGARAEWTALLDGADAPRGPERGRILYDLGNVAFRQGKLLEAVGWYTSALQYRPRDGDTWANLEEARSRAHLEPADRGDLSSTLRRIVRSWTRAESGWIALCGLLACAAALAFEALRGGRLGRWLAIGGVCVALIASAPWIDAVSRARGDPVMVVEADKASVYSEPREKATVVAEVAAGTSAERIDELPDWVKVRTDGGAEGWVKSTSMFALHR